MDDWFTPGMMLTIAANLLTVGVLYGRMSANMANLTAQISRISEDVHEMRNALGDLGKLAATLSAKVDAHERKLDRAGGSP